MGSGCFPLDNSEPDRKIIVKIINELTVVLDRWYNYISSGDSGGNQFDNAMSDGRYYEDISLSRKLLMEVVNFKEEEK